VIERRCLVPIVLSPIVIAFGYVVAIGPVGFASLALKPHDRLRAVEPLFVRQPRDHCRPHPRPARLSLFIGVAWRKLNPELEEQARTIGAPPWWVALTVSLPLAWRRLWSIAAFWSFSSASNCSVCRSSSADPANVLVLTTYLFKLTKHPGHAVLSADGRGGWSRWRW